MEKIDKYLLDELTGDLYALEAKSSIGLAKEIANKINELVDSYNHLIEVNYQKVNEQDGRIRQGILYMKDNLEDTLRDLMDMLIKDGYVDSRIKENISILIERVDNLLGSIKEGSTTMDAEVIDIRTDINGGVHLNAGTSIRRQFINEAYTKKDVVTTANYKEILPDANNIDEPCTYQLNFNYGSGEITKNLPYTEFRSSIDELITFKDKYYRQLLIGNTYVYTRTGVKTSDGITYNEWICLFDKLKEDSNHKKSFKSNGIVDDSNYLEVLPDANKILENSTYQLNFSYNNESIPMNLPYTKFKGRIDELITFADKYYRQLLISDKYIYMRNGILAASKDSVDYSSWILVWTSEKSDTKTVVVDINGNGDYTSLTKAIAENNTNTKFIIKSGLYNIVNEYEEYYGSNYFNNYVGYNTSKNIYDRGLNLLNGCELIGLGNVIIYFEYNGDNTEVNHYFAPINTTMNNKIENITIRVKNGSGRYHIHDDFASGVSGINTFKNIRFEGNTSLNTCIGAGMGIDNHYIIESCYFEGDSGYNISYHNNINAGKNRLIIKDCYCNSIIRIVNYGASLEKSEVLISGCKLKEISTGYVDSTTYPNENMEVIEWNNIIG